MSPPFAVSTANNRKRKILPMTCSQDSTPSSPALSESSSLISDDGDGEYAPEPVRPIRKAKRPRDNDFKSNSGGRSGATTNSHGNSSVTAGGNSKVKAKGMSREQLRKVNHSLIERRRREKINAALNELRRMVPGLGENGRKGGEFKLEVLEKTVEHMKDLKGRLADLERTDAIPVNNPSCASRAHCKDRETELEVESRSQSKTSPYPSPSPDRQQFPNSHPPDPNETEVESNLPPPYTLARRARARSRAHAPSLPPTSACISASNLGTTTSKEPRSQSLWSGQTQEQVTDHLYGQRGHQSIPSTRPKPPTNAPNPIFLPFPSPSPTSPFLHPNVNFNTNPNTDTLNSSSVVGSMMPGENEGLGSGPDSSSSVSVNGSVQGGAEARSTDPSPFLPPIPSMSLFSIMSLENSPMDTFRQAYIEGFGGTGKSRSFSPPELNLEDQSQTARRSSLAEPKGAMDVGMSTMNTEVKERWNGPNDKSTSIDSDKNSDKQQDGLITKAGANTNTDTEMLPEEAANLLLAFSSPETLRPLGDGSVVPFGTGQGYGQGQGQGQIRRMVEEFSLDSEAAFESESGSGLGAVRPGKIGKERLVSPVNMMRSTSQDRLVVGKSVRDILKLT
ncbi:hypothetical protein C348_03450 [Cryptococcus neoformans Gb118]|nr:hypothetical protein C350_03196 [Cryptococcus neoformans var. grubii MW-RSA36]OXL08115.1 hypothetical protein C348_03450 [Cryptococcus neoformans var. grubii Gb118]